VIQTVEAVIDERGTVRLLKPIRLPVAHRALVTILEESPTSNFVEVAPLEEWNIPRNDVDLLLRETAAWDAASDEDAMKLEKMLAEKK
jgi:hypothetical protein